MWKFCKLWLHWLFSGLCHFIVIAILTKGKKKRLAASAALQSALITSKISCRRSLQAAGTRMRGPGAKGQTRAENLSGEIVGIRNLETIKVLDIRLQKSIENSFKLLPGMFNIRPGRTKCFYENFGSFMKFNCSRAGNNSMNYIALPSSFSIPISRRMKWNHNIILKSTISFLDNIQQCLYSKWSYTRK